jgi:hypothetical protein
MWFGRFIGGRRPVFLLYLRECGERIHILLKHMGALPPNPQRYLEREENRAFRVEGGSPIRE